MGKWVTLPPYSTKVFCFDPNHGEVPKVFCISVRVSSLQHSPDELFYVLVQYVRYI